MSNNERTIERALRAGEARIMPVDAAARRPRLRGRTLGVRFGRD